MATETGSYIASNGASSAPEQVLVISDIEAHSAEDLCASDLSRGPDFVSQYGKKFCNMTTKRRIRCVTDQSKRTASMSTKLGRNSAGVEGRAMGPQKVTTTFKAGQRTMQALKVSPGFETSRRLVRLETG